jgi:hypothetical protein
MCHRTEVEPQSPAYDTLTKTIAVKVPRLAVTVYASLDGWMVDMAISYCKTHHRQTRPIS